MSEEDQTTMAAGADMSAPPSASAHDITTMSDLPPKRMKTKMWPMSPIESLTQEEVLAIATRDQTPVMIAVMSGDTSGEQYLCSNKRGASLPPEIAAEGSWAQKYYQQVAVLTNTVKELKESFEPVWELAKSQQALLVSVEIFDGLLAVADQGTQLVYRSWDIEDRKSIITADCYFRTYKQASYFSILKNHMMGNFTSLDPQRKGWVEDLLRAGETYLVRHASYNGFRCPNDVRALFAGCIPLKGTRNKYSHPLTLANRSLASAVLQRLRASILSGEFEFMKGTRKLLLLGTDYAETVLATYGKVRERLFLEPYKNPNAVGQSQPSPPDSPDGSPRPSLQIGTQSPQDSERQLRTPLILTFPDLSQKFVHSQPSTLETPSSSQDQNPGTSQSSQSPQTPNSSRAPQQPQPSYQSPQTLQSSQNSQIPTSSQGLQHYQNPKAFQGSQSNQTPSSSQAGQHTQLPYQNRKTVPNYQSSQAPYQVRPPSNPNPNPSGSPPNSQIPTSSKTPRPYQQNPRPTQSYQSYKKRTSSQAPQPPSKSPTYQITQSSQGPTTSQTPQNPQIQQNPQTTQSSGSSQSTHTSQYSPTSGSPQSSDSGEKNPKRPKI